MSVNLRDEVSSLRSQAVAEINEAVSPKELENIKINFLGRKGRLTNLFKRLADLTAEEKREFGLLVNETKKLIEGELALAQERFHKKTKKSFDPTIPGTKKGVGHLHLITQAIDEVAEIFHGIGFTRSRYREVEWDWYAFEALGFTKDHPARDEWETFIIDHKEDKKLGPQVLTPHTSSGQIREMQRLGTPPVRMINIAKCHRRQSDATHYPMFHQIEGLVIDKGIAITHLKGTLDYFVKSFFGEERKIRLRPYNFPFTEPSFEVDVSCGICGGSGKLKNGKSCKSCKEGWHEVLGAGMVHPTVLRNGGFDPEKVSGFAFGCGIERITMMKEGINIDDLRQLYSTDLRYLTQF